MELRGGNDGCRQALLITLLLGVWMHTVNCYIPDDLTIPVDGRIPRIRPLRRQVRNFEPDRTGHITVVYQTTHPDDHKVRWFRKSEGLAEAEIPGHLTTEGYKRYEYRELSVNDIRAVTLKVKDVALKEFPMSFVLVITAGHPAVEYQLYTTIEHPFRKSRLTFLDEIRWVALPGTPLIFSFHGFLSVTCVAVLDSESKPPALDELNMYRMTFDKDVEPTHRNRKRITSRKKGANNEGDIGNITSVGMGLIHEETRNYVQEAGAYMSIGSRTELPMAYLRYEMTRRIKNATRKDEGAYACKMGRKEDLSFASSWVKEGRPHRHPALEILACDPTDKSKRRWDHDWAYKITLTRYKETCIRCRAFGYPLPDIAFVRDDEYIVSDETRDVSEHVNVADGGLMEVTLTLWRPTKRDNGIYECRAFHNSGVEKLKFKLDVK